MNTFVLGPYSKDKLQDSAWPSPAAVALIPVPIGGSHLRRQLSRRTGSHSLIETLVVPSS